MKHLTRRLKDIIRQNSQMFQFKKPYAVSPAVVALCFFLVLSCNGCPSPPKPQSKAMNIIVILDTSDRIAASKYPTQVEDDIELVKDIVNYYHEQSMREMFLIRNRLTFVVPNQPQTERVPRNITEKLRIWPTREDIDGGALKFEKIEKDALSAIDELYAFVGNQKKYTGSDIWSWFRLRCEIYLKKGMRNYIVCLSDGYLDFDKSIQDTRPRQGNKTSYIPYSQIVKFWDDSDWKETFDTEGHGFLEVQQDFSDYNVKFIMVEMDLRDERDNPEIIETYWRNWLSSMGIMESEFVYSDGDAIDKIVDFISQDNKTEQ